MEGMRSRLLITRIQNFLVKLLASFGLLVILVTFTPLVYWYATWLVERAGPWNVAEGDILIVLSASAGPDGLLARDSYLRATYGVLLWREGHFAKVLICGRDAGPEMRKFMIFSGVPAGTILLEEKSVSTHENALFAAAMLRGDPGRKMLLTSDFHMFRAINAFRRAGLQVEALPIPDVRKYSQGIQYRWPIAVDLAQETLKILYYRWKGWI
jgi:uncharacterized SAM-binding protein YcdF (DUF218 family)